MLIRHTLAEDPEEVQIRLLGGGGDDDRPAGPAAEDTCTNKALSMM